MGFYDAMTGSGERISGPVFSAGSTLHGSLEGKFWKTTGAACDMFDSSFS